MKKYLITLKNITFSMLVFFLLYEDASSEALDIFPIQNERVNYQGVVETASNYTDQQIFEAAKISPFSWFTLFCLHILYWFQGE